MWKFQSSTKYLGMYLSDLTIFLNNLAKIYFIVFGSNKFNDSHLIKLNNHIIKLHTYV